MPTSDPLYRHCSYHVLLHSDRGERSVDVGPHRLSRQASLFPQPAERLDPIQGDVLARYRVRPHSPTGWAPDDAEAPPPLPASIEVATAPPQHLPMRRARDLWVTSAPAVERDFVQTATVAQREGITIAQRFPSGLDKRIPRFQNYYRDRRLHLPGECFSPAGRSTSLGS